MIYLYRFFYNVLRFFAQALKPLFSQSLQNWLNLRQTDPQQVLSNAMTADRNSTKKIKDTRLLFHASSGEIEYIKSLIREIKSQRPEIKLFVSYSSPSAEKLFSNIQDSVEAFMPLPWDRPCEITSFLDLLKPHALIFSRTDFWPELITQAKKKNIPLIGVSLFTANHPLGLLQKIWLRFVLKDFEFLTAVTEKTTQSFKNLFPSKEIYFFPDTRFDQVFHRLSQESKIPAAAQLALTANSPSKKKTIVFGSTWPEDEAVLLPCLTALIEKNFQIIFAPHDVSPTRISSLQKKMVHYKTILFSDLLTTLPPPQFDILLLDRVGYLADMYRLSDYAFVGGSFKKKVHSVMEPLCAGNRVILGPYYHNNPEAVHYVTLADQSPIHVVHSREEFLAAIDLFNSTPVAKDYIQSEMQKNQGASKSICELILKKIIR